MTMGLASIPKAISAIYEPTFQEQPLIVADLLPVVTYCQPLVNAEGSWSSPPEADRFFDE
jgi:hypothetical protein